MPPQVIAGRYEVVRPIGSGGMGTVWLCRDTVLGREVAVKQIGALPGEPAAAARAMREARIAASLNDPHAVGVFDVVDENDSHWLVMEYVEGQSLAERIREVGALPPTRVAAIGSAVASALARAHERGIVHRDIKPGNILIDLAGTPKISDFGIARAQADDQLTQTGFMTGTPGYLSPELARGGDPTPASDVWALGATLFYAVEGQPPYEAQANPLATLQAISRGDGRPVEKAGPLGGAIAAMMDRDPERRWDMATASDRLDRIAHGDATMALPAGALLGAGADPAATEVIAAPVESTQRFEPAPLPPPPVTDPYAARGTAPRDDRDGRSRATAWIVALVVLALIALGIAYALTDGFGTNTPTPGQTTTVTSTQTKTETPSETKTTSSTTSSSTTTTTTTSTTTDTSKDDAALTRFIESYYRDVTKANKRNDTFAQLTPAMQQASDGREGYETFWDSIESVDVGNVEADSANDKAVVELTFKPKDGDESDETHTLTFVRDGDSWLIDSDRQ
ncbi:Serine/threonine protein kinase [Pedococcus dokdonensis]|uniref:non-specific serine/threonine protein kinase n=1 Tax=Pedococcus dokdonensis TaxID=443156 RepID=A0A1H0R2W0_9MICO|nr:serine/threonine-protein kinase [Pedococcus dokdonensis]SDP23861.1 Serine/threonine protein kinase [Pedococcus dokdonensis]